MYQKTTGIVLHTIKYNEKSNIVEMYTELYGRASFLVPATRSKKATVKTVLFQPLAMIELEANFRPNASLHRIREARLLQPFSSIPFDPYKSAIALFLADFLYRSVREETENKPLFEYLKHSISWLDECRESFANFHLVFLMRLTRFLGLYPNMEDYHQGDYFDLLNAIFVTLPPSMHSHYIGGEEAHRVTQLMRMNYDTMHLFGMSRGERMRCLKIISEYYGLHIPGFREPGSMDVLQELFDA